MSHDPNADIMQFILNISTNLSANSPCNQDSGNTQSCTLKSHSSQTIKLATTIHYSESWIQIYIMASCLVQWQQPPCEGKRLWTGVINDVTLLSLKMAPVHSRTIGYIIWWSCQAGSRSRGGVRCADMNQAILVFQVLSYSHLVSSDDDSGDSGSRSALPLRRIQKSPSIRWW